MIFTTIKIGSVRTLCVFALLTLAACATQKNGSIPKHAFDAQAHRGGKGLMPENTIPAMLNAIDLGVNTLEMDLQITKDKQVIVSHDASFNPNFTTTPDGKTLSAAEAKKLLLYGMNYEDIKKYDVGMKPYADFPRQKKIAVHKPLLAELLAATEKYAKEKGRNIFYNIEIKSGVKSDNINHPAVEEFVDLAMAVINRKGVANRTIIQSFDNRALQVMHRKYPGVATSLLIMGTDKRSFEKQIEDLGFIPHTYSPQYILITPGLISKAHQKGMKILPWTVNDLNELRRLKNMGVDGIISDYPDLFAKL